MSVPSSPASTIARHRKMSDFGTDRRRSRLAFCTLGMFIIDRIEYLDNQQSPQENIIGGAGTYAALGSRLAAGPRNAHLVSWIVDMGSDFPPRFRQVIESWRTSCVFRHDAQRHTTTAWNGYGENEFRAFKYITPKLRLDENDLNDEQLLSRSFHMVCSPARCISLVQGILDRRKRLLVDTSAGVDDDRPIFVWEPVPHLCTPEELSRLREAAGYLDVVSPNADEFASFFEGSPECQTKEIQVQYLLGVNHLRSG
ncbi:uncharacterized protein PV07_12519 [Cladophialophora immunda]|uniref:Carbohydrate kinase PfkB domain-containing protein n=1 Tax=Cladophialophora immunda TaxID=569365 RepID=A0A0D2BSS8_9EURO|nr:uncharacterized protein PV07_12519 [Cladophialophora immunda]KIW22103.1 hypothetical protein PV07_12519 [Cladophialophora immunda]